jgi:hypothetical protein
LHFQKSNKGGGSLKILFRQFWNEYQLKEKIILMLAEDDDLLDYLYALEYYSGKLGTLIFRKNQGIVLKYLKNTLRF